MRVLAGFIFFFRFSDFCGMEKNEKFSVQPFSKGWQGLGAEP